MSSNVSDGTSDNFETIGELGAEAGAECEGGEPFLTAPADLERVRERAVSFVADAVADAGAEGVVVNVSGGLDSSVAAALAAEALGGERVLGLCLPATKVDAGHAVDARAVAERLGIEYREQHLRPLLEAFEATVGDGLGLEADEEGRVHSRSAHRTVGNATARLRMACAYYAANATSRLVLGTANRSEHLLGYVTKYGDGGVDVQPLGDLYKTEVRALGAHLGLPSQVVQKAPTAGFLAGQTDETDLGAPYETIDRLLLRALERGEPLEAVADDLGLDRETARSLGERCERTAHKRRVPPTPGIGRSEASEPGRE